MNSTDCRLGRETGAVRGVLRSHCLSCSVQRRCQPALRPPVEYAPYFALAAMSPGFSDLGVQNPAPDTEHAVTLLRNLGPRLWDRVSELSLDYLAAYSVN